MLFTGPWGSWFIPVPICLRVLKLHLWLQADRPKGKGWELRQPGGYISRDHLDETTEGWKEDLGWSRKCQLSPHLCALLPDDAAGAKTVLDSCLPPLQPRYRCLRLCALAEGLRCITSCYLIIHFQFNKRRWQNGLFWNVCLTLLCLKLGLWLTALMA